MQALSHLGLVILSLTIAVGLLYLFALLGRMVRIVLPRVDWPYPVNVLWDVYVGMIAGAGLTTILGMTGLFNPLVFAAVLAIGLLTGLTDSGVLAAPWYAVYEVVSSFRAQGLLVLALGVVVVIGIVPTAAPEIFYDALYYHLGLPSQYLLAGEIQWFPGIIHSAFPAFLDILFGMCLGLGGIAVAKFFNFLLFVLAWGATAVFVQEVIGDKRVSIVGAAVIGTTPGVMIISTMCGIDAALIGYASMTGLAIARMQRTEQSDAMGLATLAALSAGFVAGSKYTGLWLVGSCALAIVAGQGVRRSAKPVLIFIGIATLIAAPWYLRNLMVIGDPIYPVLRALSGDSDAIWAIDRLRRDVPASGLSVDSVIGLIVGLVSNPGRFGAGAEPGLLIPLGFVGLCVGALRASSLRPWMVATVAYGIVWLAQSSVIRYLYPVFPFCALGIAWVAHRVLERFPRPAIVSAMLLVLALAPLPKSVHVLDTLYNGKDVAALFSGSLSQDDYLARRLAYYPAAQWINSHTPPDARIYYLGETRLSYLDRRVSLTSAYDHHEMAQLLEPNSLPILDLLKNRGITHLVINGREIERLRGAYDYLPLSSDAEQRLRAALSACQVVFVKSGVQVCELPH